ncbi:uncharacterized protein KY384_008862 [Bacidia gigantensis]|uniref:uncharacterized protein n=1 Tax=Bacidia gigantensis TaxID=2732470 RepID=UPI001D05153A|nr:uncharacterized protein KY384_008862 [Bacidia gigantensis]KAG8525218.1 hypothetical protein KY384_008862 [Bacidia gigantensis]
MNKPILEIKLPRTKKRVAKGEASNDELSKAPRKRQKQSAAPKTSKASRFGLYDHDSILPQSKKLIAYSSGVQNTYPKAHLLGIPTEVREIILTHLFGNKCIHLKHKAVLGSREWDGGKPSKDGRFRLAICKLESSKAKDFVQAATIGTGSRHPSMTCHRNCARNWQVKSQELDLACLSTCRKLYAEAHSLLWARNTFVFDNRFTLSKFVSSLTTGQRRSLERIHIIADMTWSWKRFPYQGQRSRKTVAAATVNALKGLKRLELDMSYGCLFPYSSNNEVHVARVATECLLPFKAVDLAEVIIHMQRYRLYRDETRPIPSEISSYVQDLHAALLAPAGGAKAKKGGNKQLN